MTPAEIVIRVKTGITEHLCLSWLKPSATKEWMLGTGCHVLVGHSHAADDSFRAELLGG